MLLPQLFCRHVHRAGIPAHKHQSTMMTISLHSWTLHKTRHLPMHTGLLVRCEACDATATARGFLSNRGKAVLMPAQLPAPRECSAMGTCAHALLAHRTAQWLLRQHCKEGTPAAATAVRMSASRTTQIVISPQVAARILSFLPKASSQAARHGIVLVLGCITYGGEVRHAANDRGLWGVPRAGGAGRHTSTVAEVGSGVVRKREMCCTRQRRRIPTVLRLQPSHRTRKQHTGSNRTVKANRNQPGPSGAHQGKDARAPRGAAGIATAQRLRPYMLVDSGRAPAAKARIGPSVSCGPAKEVA
jgi:hypothetical protein